MESPAKMADRFKYQLKSCDNTGLNIFKWQPGSIIDTKHPIKGLIVDNDGKIVAPGVKVPLEPSVFNKKEISEMLLDPSNQIDTAHDGVLLRLFHLPDGTLHVSSSGMITPNKGWGPHYGNTHTIMDLYQDVKHQFDESKLVQGYCYYCILVHKEHNSFTIATTNKLVLISIVNISTMEDVARADHPMFEYFEHTQSTSPFKTREELLTWYNSDCDYGPVNPDFYGVIITLENGKTLRVVDNNCARATQLLPNLPDPCFHWIELLFKNELDILPSDIDEFMDYLESDKITEYLVHFPHYTKLFREMRVLYIDTLTEIMSEYKKLYSSRLKEEHMPYIEGRHIKFIEDLLMSYSEGDMSLIELAYYLACSDTRRIGFILNPYQIPSR